jgi:hypothetical protein
VLGAHGRVSGCSLGRRALIIASAATTAVLPEGHSAVEDQHLVQLGAVGPQDVGGVDELTPGQRCLVPDWRLPELARRSDPNLELLAVLMCFLPSHDQVTGQHRISGPAAHPTSTRSSSPGLMRLVTKGMTIRVRTSSRSRDRNGPQHQGRHR